MYKWSKAIVNYAKVAKEVEPRKKEVEKMDKQLKQS